MKAQEKFWVLAGCVLMGLGLSQAQPAIAADTILLTYGFLSMDIPIADMETFAAGEEPSGELSELLTLAGQEPDTLRTSLNTPIPVNTIVLDVVLNSPPGEWVLDTVSETIQPTSGVAGRSALRAAIVGAAADDDTLTLLEVMQVYPSPDLVVQGDRLMETYSQLYEMLEPLQELAKIIDELRRAAE